MRRRWQLLGPVAPDPSPKARKRSLGLKQKFHRFVLGGLELRRLRRRRIKRSYIIALGFVVIAHARPRCLYTTPVDQTYRHAGPGA